jgi:hypothetical protein
VPPHSGNARGYRSHAGGGTSEARAGCKRNSRLATHTFRRGVDRLRGMWRTRDIQVTLVRLARGSDDRQALTEAARPGVGKELIAWWHRHDEPGDPLWQD